MQLGTFSWSHDNDFFLCFPKSSRYAPASWGNSSFSSGVNGFKTCFGNENLCLGPSCRICLQVSQNLARLPSFRLQQPFLCRAWHPFCQHVWPWHRASSSLEQWKNSSLQVDPNPDRLVSWIFQRNRSKVIEVLRTQHQEQPTVFRTTKTHRSNTNSIVNP